MNETLNFKQPPIKLRLRNLVRIKPVSLRRHHVQKQLKARNLLAIPCFDNIEIQFIFSLFVDRVLLEFESTISFNPFLYPF